MDGTVDRRLSPTLRVLWVGMFCRWSSVSDRRRKDTDEDFERIHSHQLRNLTPYNPYYGQIQSTGVSPA
ncbi:hypothetical protein CBR_g50958 [Chara braunii]|uniref:Uncharacterized protein n=1 Tax=Chara braunii TaxID=69332 RepID=A0A388M7Q3_CHABU|nr:hypothetical protein CBR_g50958 [Chara braunii]|eukprot:GBG90614.1 hypothetical protein CBR_g50958 [Chara braunii]